MTASPGAPLKRLLCRSRSRLILAALAALGLYCLQQGPSTGNDYRPSLLPLYHHHPQVASSQHRRAVLQRNNASLHPSNSGHDYKNNATTLPPQLLPVTQVSYSPFFSSSQFSSAEMVLENCRHRRRPFSIKLCSRMGLVLTHI
jgi:hypothetical protein